MRNWTVAGGLLEGLTREVAEETGLVVLGWQGPVYEIDAVAEGLGWRLRVEVYVATGYEGDLRPDDPDGIVVDARFVGVDDCAVHLEAAHRWVREPVGEWLAERWEGSRSFGYHIAGTDLASLHITRL